MTMTPGNMNSFMESMVEDTQNKINEILAETLQKGIDAGFILVRQGSPVFIREADSAKITLHHSLVIEYLGAEKIEELEKENAYLKKMNGDLHSALSDFYEKSKVNQWLKRNDS